MTRTMLQAGDMQVPQDAASEAVIIAFVHQAGLAPATAAVRLERLTGGISSDIWRVEAGDTVFCVKRALPRLRVAADWPVPVERNANEVAWFEVVAGFMPEAVPQILAEDAAAGIFAMQYLDPAHYPNWKAELRAGRVSLDAAKAVGARLARIHSITAKRADLPPRFASDEIFHAIRLRPYLLATAERHPDLAARLQQIAQTTATSKHALVHGDVSPKNVLIGPRGPIFLDAECAWWGDPAFDIAFCLNHLLLKCLWVPASTDALIAAFRALAASYLAGADWDPLAAFEARTSHLLTGLLLARVDGMSPAEYVTKECDKNRVRKVSRTLLREPVDHLAAFAEAWRRELNS